MPTEIIKSSPTNPHGAIEWKIEVPVQSVGWIGLGKLGFPCALALHMTTGRTIYGYDPVNFNDWLKGQEYPYKEQGMQELLDEYKNCNKSDTTSNSFRPMAGVKEVVDALKENSIIFISVQTPHTIEFGGESPMPHHATSDFEYAYLASAVKEIVRHARGKSLTMVIVSTVLPGTMARVIKPLLPANINLLYNPFFIAMGTTIKDFTEPEFVLIGDDNGSSKDLVDLYASMHSKPVKITSIESAELAKVAYNTFISLKVVFANTIMEICEKTAADCDEVIDVLSLATDRVISPAYMRGGMGDGGHCHPRDNIAMSHLAKKLDLSFDLMGTVSRARDAQALYIADITAKWVEMVGHTFVTILGKTYKPESDLTGGSPALLVGNLLKDQHIVINYYDPFTDGELELDTITRSGRVFLIGTKHKIFKDLKFKRGSVVIDPFGYILDQAGVTVIRIGRKS